MCRLSAWQRFSILELPAATNNLVWNAILSFGGGWFFVVQSEAVTVQSQRIQLPGLGSLMAASLETADTAKALQSIGAMVAVIWATDQLLWRPLLDWSERFKTEPSPGDASPGSKVYRLLQGSNLPAWIRAHVQFGSDTWRWWLLTAFPRGTRSSTPLRLLIGGLCRKGAQLLAVTLALLALWKIANNTTLIVGELARLDLPKLLRAATKTLLRVCAMTLVASAVWVPVAVLLGQSRRASRILQPVFQMAASFPVNMTFPLIVGFFVAHRVSMEWGSVLLLLVGPQWYVLFNVTGAAASTPEDLKEVARCYGLRGLNRWKVLLLPAVYPAWVTGACTATGAAWNASIVAEVATWGPTTLRAEGLGSLISGAVEGNHGTELAVGIGMMASLVVLMNKLLWRPLYALAERRFGFEM